MADDKELIKKDLAMILKLDAQIDYSQKIIVEKYYKDIMAKGLLTTPHGKRYIMRLEQIIDGDTIHNKCAFCNLQTQGDTLICPACMAKLRKPAVYCRSCGNKMNATDHACPVCGKNKDEGYQYCAHCGKEVPMPDMETFANNVKNKSKEFAGQAAKIAKENVQNIAEKSAKLAEDMVTDVKTAKEEKAENESKSKERNSVNKKNPIAWIAVLLTAVVIAGTIGLDTVFAFFAFATLVVLIYKAVKKKPKKGAAIAFIVFLLLSGMAGALSNSNGVPDNVLDYLGTKESVVYQTYDKDSFMPLQGINRDFLTNEQTDTMGAPYIWLDDSNPRCACCMILKSGMNASLNVNGLHIGDDIKQVEKCMKQLKAVYDSDDSSKRTAMFWSGALTLDLDVTNLTLENTKIMVYEFKYQGKNMFIYIDIIGGSVSGMQVGYT